MLVSPAVHRESHIDLAALLPEGNDLYVICGNTTVLRLAAVKVEGRKKVSAAEFAHGARLTKTERFGDAELR